LSKNKLIVKLTSIYYKKYKNNKIYLNERVTYNYFEVMNIVENFFEMKLYRVRISGVP
jgi:hypothetical protein